MHTDDPLVSDPSPLVVKIVRKLKLIQLGGMSLHLEIHKFMYSVWKREEFPQQ
jgi:hypothetical protein